MSDGRTRAEGTRDPKTIPAKLTVNCTRAEKSAWIAAAEAAGTKLEPWVVRLLNEAAAGRGSTS